MRDALRIFRLTLLIRLGLLGLSFLAMLRPGHPAHWGILVSAAPTLLLALLFLPPWLERALGRSFLGLGLGLDVFFASITASRLFFQWPSMDIARSDLPPVVIEQLTGTPPIEPFFFLLIPLVLLAWGYGRRGALWGSTLATIMHLGTGLWLWQQGVLTRTFFVGALTRIALLYLVPLLVSVLAEREREQHAQLQVAHQRLRRHTATIEQLATSRERNRLARDLHDTLAHSLSALTVQLEALRSLLANHPGAAPEAVDEISALARRGLAESRQAIQALRTDRVETMGLVGALRDMIHSFQARTGVPARMSVAGNEPDLTQEEAQALFRIAEEGLTNAERHAFARQVTTRLAFGADRIDLVIQDDGVGFDPATVDPDRYGLTGMQERAAMIGATVDVHSRPGGGTEVWCALTR